MRTQPGHASPPPECSVPGEGAQEALREAMNARDALFVDLSAGVCALLPQARAQDVEDALLASCIELDVKPVEALLLLHTLLSNWTALTDRKEHSL